MIVVVSAGPGDPELLTVKGSHLIKSADVLSGFDAVVNQVKHLATSSCTVITMGYKDQEAKLLEVAQLHHAGKLCVVVAMGDVHFSGFQLLERVETACGHQVETIPGISSIQVLASRTRVCLDETTPVTFHRRGDLEPFKQHLFRSLKEGRNAIIIPRPWDFMPKNIAEWVIAQGIDENLIMEVWERLTSKDEATWKGPLKQCHQDFSDMSIVLIRSSHPFPSQL